MGVLRPTSRLIISTMAMIPPMKNPRMMPIAVSVPPKYPSHSPRTAQSFASPSPIPELGIRTIAPTMTPAHAAHRATRSAVHAVSGNGVVVAASTARRARVAALAHRAAGPRIRLGSLWHTASTLHAAPSSATMGSATITSPHTSLIAPHASVSPHRIAARTACETGVSSHRARKVVGSKVVLLLGEVSVSAGVASFAGPAPGVGALSVESLDEAAVASASACSRSDTYCRAKAETRRATTATAVPPTAMADSNAGTFIATLSHACRIFGMGQMPCPCPEGPRPAASSRSSRVQHHALIPLSALARSCGKRVAWPTVPADGSPHLHSVPSDVDFGPGPSARPCSTP